MTSLFWKGCSALCVLLPRSNLHFLLHFRGLVHLREQGHPQPYNDSYKTVLLAPGSRWDMVAGLHPSSRPTVAQFPELQDLAEAGLLTTFVARAERKLPCSAGPTTWQLCFLSATLHNWLRISQLLRPLSSIEAEPPASASILKEAKQKPSAAFKGKGSRAVKRELLQGDSPTLPVLLQNGQQIHLRLVSSYVHLGSIVTHAASPLNDIKAKAQSASVAFQRLRKTLLRNPELEPCEKVELIRSLSISKLSYGAALWTIRSNVEQNACNLALMKFWRAALRPVLKLCPVFMNDHEVCACLRVLTPAQFLRVERVRQLRLVVNEGQSSFGTRCCRKRTGLPLPLLIFGTFATPLAIALTPLFRQMPACV